jgi:hypothetical protein
VPLSRCTSLALAFTCLGAIPLVNAVSSVEASAATVSQTAAASAPSAVSSAASARSDDPTSSGVLPTMAASVRSHHTTNIPTWMRRALPEKNDQLTDGVVLGPTSHFSALGNNQGIGDCAIVAVRDVFLASTIRSRHRVEGATTAQAVATWRGVNGDTSDGLTDLKLLDAWSEPSGLLGSTISGWASLNVGWTQKIKQAIVSTSGLYASLYVPANISWSTLVWSRPASSSVSMTDHAVALVGWVPEGWLAVSWGEIVLIPWSDWRAEAIGAYAVNPIPAASLAKP